MINAGVNPRRQVFGQEHGYISRCDSFTGAGTRNLRIGAGAGTGMDIGLGSIIVVGLIAWGFMAFKGARR